MTDRIERNGAKQAPLATTPYTATRRHVLAGATTLASGMALGCAALAQEAAAEDAADFLFVQTAKGMTFDPADSRLTLTGVSPITLFFSDRPERIAGNMKTTAFIPFWSEGADSFLSDPPNADLSILNGDALRQTVVVLRDPALDGENLVYVVEVIDGELPASGAEVSVFIDVIGMPRTPLSYAGVARRGYRRAVLY